MARKVTSNSNNQLAAANLPGLVTDSRGILFSVQSLPEADHFFTASDYMINVDAENVHILFGQKSKFSQVENNTFRLAIEIVFPREQAVNFWAQTIYENASISGDEPYYFALKSFMENNLVDESFEYGAGSALPTDPASYRQFAANFATSTMSGSQSLLEFFECAPSVIVNLQHKKQVRPNSGVKAVVSVLMPTSLQFHLYSDLKSSLGV